MTVVIAPSLGHGAPFTQLGVGTSPGYDAIDLRRAYGVGLSEAPRSMGSYTVGQRGAGANMSVDIAASTGLGVVVQGDTVTAQGLYPVPPHSAVINEAIATADATNPRIDSVILELKDSVHDASGLNQAQTRVLTGTPTGGVTNEAPGASPAALPNSAILLAYVQVDAAVGSIVTAKIKDMRPKKRGYILTAGSESTTATTYAYNNLATPDRITQLVVPAGGLLEVGFQAIWQNTVTVNARAAIFIGANQLKVGIGTGAPTVNELSGPTETNDDATISTSPIGLVKHDGVGASTEVTTGQVIAPSQTIDGRGGRTVIFVAAGTYDVGIQFKNNAAGTTSVKNRHLWAEVRDYDQCHAS